MTGLYIHIPFCRKKCHYCNFVITTSTSKDHQLKFVSLLQKEVRFYRNQFNGVMFDTVYFGGGTPSVLNEAEFETLFGILKENFKWKSDAEVTVEANPGDATPERAEVYHRLGVNRISLGAQTFREESLDQINRAHGPAEISESFRIFRDSGFENISLDLILSLPGETLEDVRSSLRQATTLGPEHISLYELTIEDKTVFGERHKRGMLQLPVDEVQLEMLIYAREFLKAQGYRHYELLSYAKAGFESRHNLIYWANGDYLGLGPGAFSYFDGRRFRLSVSYDEYIGKIGNKNFVASEEETLSSEKRETESFLLSLRLAEGADLERFPFVRQKFHTTLTDLKFKGLLEETNNRIHLTSRGQFFAETVFSDLSL